MHGRFEIFYYYRMLLQTLVIFLAVGNFWLAAAAKPGVLSLDAWNFDKVVSGSRDVLVKFDKEYAYGDAEDQWAEFAKNVGEMGKQADRLLIAEVGKQEYGDKKNADLHERFDINWDDIPVIKLFQQKVGKLEKETILFKGTVTKENLSVFVRSEAGIWIGIPGCLEKYDELAVSFMRGSKKEAVLKSAKDLMSSMEKDSELAKSSLGSAKAYVRVMEKVVKDGDEFINKEVNRVTKLKDGKISDEKKNFFQNRINILSSFKAAMIEDKKDEEKKDMDSKEL